MQPFDWAMAVARCGWDSNWGWGVTVRALQDWEGCGWWRTNQNTSIYVYLHVFIRIAIKRVPFRLCVQLFGVPKEQMIKPQTAHAIARIASTYMVYLVCMSYTALPGVREATTWCLLEIGDKNLLLAWVGLLPGGCSIDHWWSTNNTCFEGQNKDPVLLCNRNTCGRGHLLASLPKLHNGSYHPQFKLPLRNLSL